MTNERDFLVIQSYLEVNCCNQALVRTQPIAGPKAKLLDALHASDPGCQFRTQQAGISGLMG
jgi:hypothetical protein